MYIKYFQTLLLIICFLNSIHSQRIDSTKDNFLFEINSGYTTFNLNEIHEFYNEMVDSYRSYNINIPTQKKYPGNMYIESNVLYKFPKYYFGFGVFYSKTSAFSKYKDYSGKLGVTSHISIFMLNSIARIKIHSTKKFDVFIEGKPGIAFINSKFINDLYIHEMASTSSKLSLNGNNISLYFRILCKYYFHKYFIYISSGYRYANIGNPEGDYFVNYEYTGGGEVDLDHNLSGISVGLGIGFAF